MLVVIVEDEKPAARQLQRKVEKHGLQVSTILHSVSQAILWFKSNEHPDLIFLDIQLSDGLSFEIFEAVQIKSAVIFTTAYDAYALRAFKLNSIDYLLKPIDEDELKAALDKFKSQKQLSNQKLDLSKMRQLLLQDVTMAYKQRFTVKTGAFLKVIPVDTIQCFYCENKGVYLYTQDNRSILMDQTLEQVANELDPQCFFQVNRTFIVALNAIKDIVVYTNSRLKITLSKFQEEEIIVSRERVAAFKSWLN
jgi:two-component system, LytTR family, response regulator LytT